MKHSAVGQRGTEATAKSGTATDAGDKFAGKAERRYLLAVSHVEATTQSKLIMTCNVFRLEATIRPQPMTCHSHAELHRQAAPFAKNSISLVVS